MSERDKRPPNSKREPPSSPERKQPMEFPREEPQPGDPKRDYDNYREKS